MGAFDDTALYNNEANWTDGVLYISNCLIDTKPKKIQGRYAIKKGTKCIAESAFAYCTKLTEIVIPDSVETIGGSAFEGCKNLKTISLPKNLKTIGCYAFSKTAFSKNAKNWTNGVLYLSNYLLEANTELKSTYKIKEGTIGIAEEAFEENKNLKKVVIPDSVKNIGEAAFYKCSNLVEVKLSKSLKYIPTQMFAECINLKNIVIPQSVTKVGDEAFYGCEKLEKLVFPNKVTCIKNSFNYCKSLLSITIPQSVKLIQTQTFEECPKLFRINYNGTKAQWKEIKIESDNEDLKNIVVHCKDGNILPIKATKIKLIKADFKTIKLTWDKVTNAKDYQIQIATDVNFIKDRKSYTVKGTSTTIKNLKSKKKYYVRVRSHRGMIYSSWSKVSSITTK